MKLYQAIVLNQRLLDQGFKDFDATLQRHRRIQAALPSGSGVDSGTSIVKADERQIVLSCGFHHMEDGYYVGWTHHTIYVRYSMLLDTLVISMTGRNRDGIKDYLCDLYHAALTAEFDWMNPNAK
jgi:hypothetical protein